MLVEKILLHYWKYIKKQDDNRLSQQNEPEGIKVISDIPYIEGAKTPNLLDVYYKEGTTQLLPVIIDVHGGGWLYGNKELNKIYAMNLALRGFGIVNINYHLAQEKRFPQQIKDIYSVFNWIYENGKNYNLDRDNVFITGDSAGAHLSSISAALLNNDEMRKKIGVDTKLNIKAGGMICGAFDLDDFSGIKKSVSKIHAKVIVGGKVKDSPYAKHISLIETIENKMIPLYLMTSSQDFVKEQTFKLVEYLKQNNLVHQFRYWDEDKSKKLYHVFNVTYPLKEESIITNDEMCDFFKKFIS